MRSSKSEIHFGEQVLRQVVSTYNWLLEASKFFFSRNSGFKLSCFS